MLVKQKSLAKRRMGRQKKDAQSAHLPPVRRVHATRCVDECHSKPHPDMLEQLMDVLGVTPDKTLMIGDTSHDLTMAHNARADCIAVSHGAHDIAALSACQPKFIAKNLHQVQQWISSSIT